MILGLASVVVLGGVKVYMDMMAASKPLKRRSLADASPSLRDAGSTYHPPEKH